MASRFTALFLISSGVLFRLIPHPPNLTPIIATTLFAPTRFSTKKSLFITFLSMFISDLFLGFHSTMPWVYGSLAAISLFASVFKSRIRGSNIYFFAFLSSFLFYLVTNFGVWLSSGLYPHSLPGLVQCYVLALPFFRNSLLGDLLFTAVFFRLLPLLSPRPTPVHPARDIPALAPSNRL